LGLAGGRVSGKGAATLRRRQRLGMAGGRGAEPGRERRRRGARGGHGEEAVLRSMGTGRKAAATLRVQMEIHGGREGASGRPSGKTMYQVFLVSPFFLGVEITTILLFAN
jgi:hypothetical protein